MVHIARYSSPVGALTVAGEDDCITGIWIEGQKYYASTLKGSFTEQSLPVIDEAFLWLDRYFAGGDPGPAPRLCPHGSRFRQDVWRILMQIPYGQFTTYKNISLEIARQYGIKSMSAQAVGGAVGHNPISIMVPCHRVLGSDGSLTGYAGGVEIKRRLLALEGVTVKE